MYEPVDDHEQQTIRTESIITKDMLDNMKKVMELFSKLFKFGSLSKEALKYVEWSLCHEGGNTLVDQKDYVDEKIDNNYSEILSDREKESFRFRVGKGHWLTDQTRRPDCSYDEPELLTMTHTATVNDIPKLNKMFLKQDSVTIKYKKLRRIDELKLTVFSDASNDNLPDGESSGMGFLVFLSVGFNPGKVSPCFPLSWTACQVQRKVSSTFAAETLFLLAALLGQVG